MEKIVPGKHVSLVYDLYKVAADGKETLVHQSDPSDPEVIIFGVTQGVIAPLEKALDGLQKNDSFDVVADSEEAFGPYLEENVVELDKDLFTVDGKFDSEMVAVGKAVPMLTADGMRIMGIVKEVSDDKVKMDFNHPLAGSTIRFKGKVLEVREPSADELRMATGEGCCGCGSGCDCKEGDCSDEASHCGCGEGCGCK